MGGSSDSSATAGSYGLSRRFWDNVLGRHGADSGVDYFEADSARMEISEPLSEDVRNNGELEKAVKINQATFKPTESTESSCFVG